MSAATRDGGIRSEFAEDAQIHLLDSQTDFPATLIPSAASYYWEAAIEAKSAKIIVSTNPNIPPLPNGINMSGTLVTFDVSGMEIGDSFTAIVKLPAGGNVRIASGDKASAVYGGGNYVTYIIAKMSDEDYLMFGLNGTNAVNMNLSKDRYAQQ